MGARALARLSILTLAAVGGCAPAVPVLGGALPTPEHRAAVSAGASFRLPLGDELPEEPAAPGGAAPVASFRHGLGPTTDLGLMAVGPLARLDVRHAILLVDDTIRTALSGAVAPYVGAVDDGGVRWGVQVPLLFTVDALSLVELWAGPRVGFESAVSDAQGAVTGLSAGGVVGLGIGFRHLHVLTELSAVYERWSGDATRSGVVLIPAFALRLRL